MERSIWGKADSVLSQWGSRPGGIGGHRFGGVFLVSGQVSGIEQHILISDWEGLTTMERQILNLSQMTTERAQVDSTPVARRIFTSAPEAPEVSFEDMLSASIRKVNSLQLEADHKVRQLAIGEVEDISEVVLASSRAEVSLKLIMELRNKLLDAYQSLSRITG